MARSASPLSPDPNYHITLTDGKDTIGLIAVNSKMKPDATTIGRNPVERSSLKTSSGNQKYSDMEPPYAALAQEDWSGGRASPDFEKDTTRYRDGTRVNTERPNRAILGGRECYSTGLRSADNNLPGSMKMVPLLEGRRKLARIFTAGATSARTLIWVWVSRKGTPNADLIVSLYQGNTQWPILLQTTTVLVDDSDRVSEFVILTIPSETVTATSTYHVQVEASADDTEDNHWMVGCKPMAGTTMETDSATWATSSVDLCFRLTDAPTQTDVFQFEYKRSLFMVTKHPDGVSAPLLYINGYAGVAASNAGQLTKLIAGGTPGWTVDELIGSIVLLPEGAGSTEAQNWRLITGNIAGELTVSTPWLVAHDATTVYVILGSNKWTLITDPAHGLTKPVTSVLVSSRNVVYFAQGEAAAIQRMRVYNNAGTWDYDFDNDGTNKAIHLEEFNASGYIGQQIIRSNGDNTISRAALADWGTDLIFGLSAPTLLNASAWAATTAYAVYDLVKPTVNNDLYYRCITAGNSGGTEPTTWPITPGETLVDGTVVWLAVKEYQFLAGASKAVGDAYDRITNLARYVDSSQYEAIWVTKESGPWIFTIDIDTMIELLDRVKIAEMKAVRSSKNGYAWVTLGVYLYFTVMNSIHRFFHPTLDDVGPTLDEGLPAGRQGPVVAMVSYPGRIFIAVDAGATGYSSILTSAGGANYHEVYRAPLGQRINSLSIQVVPGSSPDRLWAHVGADMLWLPLPSDTFDPYQDAEYPFTHEGVIEMADIFAGLQDAYKYFKKLKAHAENLVEDVCWIEADYKVDDAETWTEMPDVFNSTPMAETEFSESVGISGKKLNLRLRLYSTDEHLTPKLLAMILSVVTVTEPKYSYRLTVAVDDKDLNGNIDERLKPHEKIRLLDEWAGTARPLKMYCVDPLFDDLKVFLNPAAARPLNSAQRVNEHTYVTTIDVQEA